MKRENKLMRKLNKAERISLKRKKIAILTICSLFLSCSAGAAPVEASAGAVDSVCVDEFLNIAKKSESVPVPSAVEKFNNVLLPENPLMSSSSSLQFMGTRTMRVGQRIKIKHPNSSSGMFAHAYNWYASNKKATVVNGKNNRTTIVKARKAGKVTVKGYLSGTSWRTDYRSAYNALSKRWVSQPYKKPVHHDYNYKWKIIIKK